MSNKEILAELKKSYEYLRDIRENGSQDHCDGQLPFSCIYDLEVAINKIEDVYCRFYKTLDKEELRITRLESEDEKVYIARNVDFDYETDDDWTISCADAEYYWYNESEEL